MRFQYCLFVAISLLFIAACTGSADSPSTNNAASSASNAQETVNDASKKDKPTIVFFGNSLTAAYGVDPESGFTAIIQRRIDSLELGYQVVNAGLSGETTAGGNSRVNWILRQPIDVFVLELGGNDGLRGIEPDATYTNLQAIIDQVKDKYPEVKLVIAGMQAPPNMGPDFTQAFSGIFPRLARENNAALIPFLLEGVGGIPELNLPDGIHPTAEGHEIVAENIWTVLSGML